MFSSKMNRKAEAIPPHHRLTRWWALRKWIYKNKQTMFEFEHVIGLFALFARFLSTSLSISLCELSEFERKRLFFSHLKRVQSVWILARAVCQNVYNDSSNDSHNNNNTIYLFSCSITDMSWGRVWWGVDVRVKEVTNTIAMAQGSNRIFRPIECND